MFYIHHKMKSILSGQDHLMGQQKQVLGTSLKFIEIVMIFMRFKAGCLIMKALAEEKNL